MLRPRRPRRRRHVPGPVAFPTMMAHYTRSGEVAAGPLVLQHVDTANIHVVIAASAGAGGDAPPLVLQHVDTVHVYVTVAASAGTDGGPRR